MVPDTWGSNPTSATYWMCGFCMFLMSLCFILFVQKNVNARMIWLHTCKALSVWHVCMQAKLLQSCLTLCDPMDYSPPGSSVHGILQARVLEWVAMPSSRESSLPRDQTHFCLVHWQVDSLSLSPPWEPKVNINICSKLSLSLSHYNAGSIIYLASG